jgi:hypothetical protein
MNKRNTDKWQVGDQIKIPSTGCVGLLSAWETHRDYLGNVSTTRLLSPDGSQAWLTITNGKRQNSMAFYIEDDDLRNLTRGEG